MTNYDYLHQSLKELDDYVSFKQVEMPPIYLAGGTACILGGYIERATTDFDIVDIGFKPSVLGYTRLLGRVDFLDLDMTTVAPGFSERAEPVSKFDVIQVYNLSREDIITTKIGRYSVVDQSDIKEMMVDADKKLLRTLIDGVVERDDLSSVLKEHFMTNVQIFLKAYPEV